MFSKILALSALLAAANAGLLGNAHSSAYHNIVHHDVPVHNAAPEIHYANADAHYGAPVIHSESHDTYVVALSALLAAANAGLLGNAHSSAVHNIVIHEAPIHQAAPAIHYANSDAHYDAPVINHESHDTYCKGTRPCDLSQTRWIILNYDQIDCSTMCSQCGKPVEMERKEVQTALKVSGDGVPQPWLSTATTTLARISE
ncbi:unnamed protein product [Arctia plantaginis]|uniref:Uncharacterized protein n=1 Tax=Arctia plantaginis TaxID=874455 RepID=A0A8S1ADM0_ARCPL|nr:unnamed protein product [Arctia plantaginis]